MSKQPPPAPTVSAVGPCPTVIQIVGRPGTGSLPSTIAPPDHPLQNFKKFYVSVIYVFLTLIGGGRVVRWCWVNFQCRGVLQFGLQ